MTTGTVKKFDWMAGVFYPLAVILMEAFWVAPWLHWLGILPMFREPRPIMGLGTVILVLALALLVTRLVVNLKIKMWAIQAIIIGAGLLTMLLVLGYEYAGDYAFLSGGWFTHTWQVLGHTLVKPDTIAAAIAAVVYLWWRGINLGQSTTIFKDIYRTFVLGMVALIVLLVLWQLTSVSDKLDSPGASIGFNVIAFFFFGLISIAICHLYVMRSTMPREDAGLTSVWRWTPVMLGVIGGVVLVGFGLASALSPEFFDSVGRGAGTIFGFLWKILEYVLIPVTYAAEGIAWVMRWFLNLLRRLSPSQEDTSDNVSSSPFQDVTTGDISPIWGIIFKWVIVAVIAAVVIFILAKAISRFRVRHARDTIEEVRDSIFSWKGLREDLKLFFNNLGNRFRRKEAGAPKYNFDDNPNRRLEIREIYRHLQWEAGKSGITRRRHETADEYADRLRRYAPDSSPPLDSLTGLYKGVRYGENAVPESQLDDANTLWRTLKGMLRKMRGG
ncbi:MAG: DUF4129 domain-containing protein [Dehalococcoidales bacterium]|jgi:hypothetical protein